MKILGRMRTYLVSAAVFLSFTLPVLASEHGESGGAPHPEWKYIIFQAINLAILLFVLYRVSRRKISASLVERHDATREALEQADRARRDAEQLKQEYERRLADLDQEVAAFKAEVEEKGKEEAARIVANSKALAERVQKDVKRLLDDELNRARHQLRKETVEIAFALAERLLRERVEESDQRRLAEQYLRQIVQSTEIH